MQSIGVRFVAVALLGFSLWALYNAHAHGRGRRGETLMTASIVLVLLALVAAEALWSLRGHAFLAYAAWAVGAMVAVALTRLNTPGGAQGVRIVPIVLYTGLVLGGVALYLKRAA